MENRLKKENVIISGIESLKVIDELRVGPVVVEKRRLVAPYTVVRGRKKDTTNFSYKFDEDVFEPGNAVDQNLANMMAAQVALNYGLFCRRIVFRGAYDAADQRFLNNMMENTSREIYVKKFLEPNPFLLIPPDSLPAARRKKYTQAAVDFPDAAGVPPRITWSPVKSSTKRVGILSSGGKDSLLSYGVLNEVGYEIHPVFCNESGRHWFTALNAFRHFEKNVPNTARVWTNSDRVFSWMLRHFPFIRQDFASLRSDEYAIRLWTVAVFLFGALPLLRKRCAGRLVIGDEYDTTTRMSHRGITHYNGLYDQSRYFDNVMSRYFSRKKWALSQFSILRPLSEFLIEGMLVTRYPKLFEHQVSCHAAHVVGQRVAPCGRCEKCRRIVGMVLANGGDPRKCGYTDEQIKACLRALTEQGIHQEKTGAEHLMWTLRKKKILAGSGKGERRGTVHPEIVKLRFDRERSPVEGIPKDIREATYPVLLQYAEGSVHQRGNDWLDFDVMKSPEFHRPYRYERSKPVMGKKKQVLSSSDGFLLAEMTWPQARQRFREVDIALLPVGSIEQHGPHLPLDTDAFDADYLAKSVAKSCSDPKPTVLPLISYGISYHHNEFSGTISIGNNTLSRLVYDIGMSLARNGVTKIVIINGHGGNDPALNFAAQEINRDARIFVCVDSGETSDVDIYSMIDTPNDVHAGEIETSTALAVRPELVRMQLAEKLVPEFSNKYLDFTSKRGISWYAFTKRISDSGVMGDPTKATAEKGHRMWEAMIRHLVAFVEDLKQLTLDEIFQKRY
jgi:creatinine amidohydrolase/Fe(II)-dependent formamide hydrolase-like protein